jgi:predicted permease
MHKLRALWRRLRGVFGAGRKDDELAAELQSHVAFDTEEGIRDGLSPEEARRRALVRLGGVEQTRQAYREQRGLPGIQNLVQDLRYALRQLVRSPGFALAAILTLTLAIGANTAIFSVVNAILRHPAGVDHPERVAAMNVRYAQFNLDVPVISVPDYALAASMKDQVEAAAVESSTSFNIVRGGVTEHISAARVSSQWFQAYGARPIAGRVFTAEEDQPNTAPVAVLSYGFWQRAFGGRMDAVGQTMMLDQKAYLVIGVMRSDFAWPRDCQLWTPIALAPAAFAPDHTFNENFRSVVRLHAGISVQQFNAAYSTKIWEELRRAGASGFAISSGWGVYAAPLAESAAGPLRKPLYVLFGVVGMILLIASANVAGLFLARSSARSKEFAIRIALGASASRIAQQLFIETALLAGVAAALGIAAGPLLGRLLLVLVPGHLAAGYAVGIDPAVLAFTAGTALLTSLIAGLGPAFKIVLERKRMQLHETGRGATSSSDKQRLRRAFVIGQMALSFLLLSGTGLFLASLQQLQHVDPGFDPHGVLAGRVDYDGQDFKKSQQRQAVFVHATVERLAAQPGVVAAAAVDPLPFATDMVGSSSFDIEGRPVGPNDPGPHSHLTFATPDYLKVMRIPLKAGRWFTMQDQDAGLRVVVIDERLARKYWPNQNPIGQQIDSGPKNRWATVIGVLSNIRAGSLEEDVTDGTRYYPFAQATDSGAFFVVRAGDDPNLMASSIKAAVASADSSQTVTSIVTVETLISDSLAGRRLIVWMLAAFAGLALLLAMVGIYGLISYVTSHRTNEIGIRMALGAKRSDVVGLVLRNALSWVLTGLAMGIALAVVATAWLRHVFAVFGGGAAVSLAAAALVLLAVGICACLIPARRAASIEPMQALRTD